MIAESISGRFTSLLSAPTSFLVTSIFVSGCDPHTNFPTGSKQQWLAQKIHSNTPVLQYSSAPIPALQYSNTPILQYSSYSSYSNTPVFPWTSTTAKVQPIRTRKNLLLPCIPRTPEPNEKRRERRGAN